MTIGIFSFIYNPKTVLSCLVFFFFSFQFSFKREAKSLNLPSHYIPHPNYGHSIFTIFGWIVTIFLLLLFKDPFH